VAQRRRASELSKSYIFLNPKDYIRLKLTDDLATEVSDASGTGLFDVKRRSGVTKLLIDFRY
jgi:xylulokinase